MILLVKIMQISNMAIFTDREKKIIALLKAGDSVSKIAEDLEISISSVSKSISKIKLKTYEIEEDIGFLIDEKFAIIEGNKLRFLHRDPKELGK